MGAGAATAGLLALAGGLPLRQLGPLEGAFDATLFADGPVSITVGRLALLGIAGFALISVVPANLPFYGSAKPTRGQRRPCTNWDSCCV